MAQCVIQARMSSSRLPGKVLLPIAGMPLLTLIYRRLSRAKLISKIIVATSSDKSDDAIAEWGEREGVTIFRGELNNVASRFNAIAGNGVTKSAVRVCGDSPFIDPDLVDLAIGMLKDTEADLVSSSNPRTTPPGMSVEVLRCKTYCDQYPNFAAPEDFEHVTKYFYDNRDKIKVVSISPDFKFSPKVQLAIDTLEDLERCQKIALALGDRVVTASGAEIVSLAEQLV